MYTIDKNILKEQKYYELMLEDVKEKERIKIDKEILERLMFKEDVYTLPIYGNVKKRVKHIIWSGKFLSKIDLSELSFDNVVWDEENEIDLSNTNAHIDFSKSCNINNYSPLKIVNCDFSNTDLSNNEIYFPISIKNSSFSDTHIMISSDYTDNISIVDSCMDNTDLSSLCITIDKFYEWTMQGGSSFVNSNLNIITYYNEECNKKFIDQINLGCLDGCTVDGGKIMMETRNNVFTELFNGSIENKKPEKLTDEEIISLLKSEENSEEEIKSFKKSKKKSL